MIDPKLQRREKAMNDLVDSLWLMMVEASKNTSPAEQQKHKLRLKRMFKMMLIRWR